MMTLIVLAFFTLVPTFAQKGETCLNQMVTFAYAAKLSGYLRQAASEHLSENSREKPAELNKMISSGEACKYVKPSDISQLEESHQNKKKLMGVLIRELNSKKKISGSLYTGMFFDNTKYEVSEADVCADRAKYLSSHSGCDAMNFLGSKVSDISVDGMDFIEACRKLSSAIASAKESEIQCSEKSAKEREPKEEISMDEPKKTNSVIPSSPSHKEPVHHGDSSNGFKSGGRIKMPGASGQ